MEGRSHFPTVQLYYEFVVFFVLRILQKQKKIEGFKWSLPMDSNDLRKIDFRVYMGEKRHVDLQVKSTGRGSFKHYRHEMLKQDISKSVIPVVFSRKWSFRRVYNLVVFALDRQMMKWIKYRWIDDFLCSSFCSKAGVKKHLYLGNGRWELCTSDGNKHIMYVPWSVKNYRDIKALLFEEIKKMSNTIRVS